tara:strand:- start:2873 stop:3130 length:258 start_codon:yes stop_codon:yes gene_type:complete
MEEDNYDIYYDKFNKLLEQKTKEIEIIYDNKFNNKPINNNENNNELSYDVKKILGKQKTHETKRKQQSKLYQKEQADLLLSYIKS